MGENINIFHMITKDLAKIKIGIGDVNATNRLYSPQTETNRLRLNFLKMGKQNKIHLSNPVII